MSETVKKNNNAVALVVTLLLCIAGIVATVLSISKLESGGDKLFTYLLIFAMYFIVIIYTFVGYKIPHSNMFRYTLLAYACLFGISINQIYAFGDDTTLVPYLIICAVLIAYMSGRLHKIKDCIAIIVIVGVAFIATSIYLLSDKSLAEALVSFNQPIIWICFSLSYLIRYNDHKNAGVVSDKEEAEEAAKEAAEEAAEEEKAE